MKRKKANEILHITFHNPNTQEEMVRELVHIAAQIAKARVEVQLLSLNQPEHEDSIFEMCMT